MSEWDSKQYLKFEQERTQPAIDLVNRIEYENPMKIIDIGCGPGNSTNVLAKKFPNASILGIDLSENMLEQAKKNYPQLDFKVGDVSKCLGDLGNDFDIVFSNACIQWVPNHHEILKQMMNILKPQGILAVQTPMNFEEPVHKIMNQLADSDRWKKYFPTKRVIYNLEKREYFDILSEIASEFTMWETNYFNKLESHGAVIDWCRGTGLKPYLDALPEEEKLLFEQDLYNQVVEHYSLQKNGQVIYSQPRFFFIAKA